MPEIHPSVDEHLSPLSEAWNAAEKSYKRAEQLGNEVAFPSINEVRYAGRKMVEVMALIKEDANAESIKDKMRDIYQDIHRAHHDSIDAGMSVIALRMKAVRDEIPAKIIRQSFPEYTDLIQKLGEVQQRIVDSREDRNARAGIYIEIENGCYSELISLFSRFLACEDLLVAEAEQEANAQKADRRASMFQGVVIGLIPSIIAFGVWAVGKLPT